VTFAKAQVIVKDVVTVHVELTSHFPAKVVFEKLELEFEPKQGELTSQYNQTFFATDKECFSPEQVCCFLTDWVFLTVVFLMTGFFLLLYSY
jgi:hypothetical protein